MGTSRWLSSFSWSDRTTRENLEGLSADDVVQFFRTVATSQGSLIIAHESNVHTLFSIAFLGAVRRSFSRNYRTTLISPISSMQIQHYLIVARQTSTVGSILRNSVISRTYPSVGPLDSNIEYELICCRRRWYILYLSSWSIIWESFTTAYIETGAAEKKSRLTPKMVNVFFIAFPLLISIAPCFTFLVLANTRYNLFFGEFSRKSLPFLRLRFSSQTISAVSFVSSPSQRIDTTISNPSTSSRFSHSSRLSRNKLRTPDSSIVSPGFSLSSQCSSASGSSSSPPSSTPASSPSP